MTSKKSNLATTTLASSLANQIMVAEAAGRLSLQPRALVTRMKSAMPAVIEQNLYLVVAEQTASPLPPEDFATLLRRLSSRGRPLRIEDFTVKVGKDLQSYSAARLVELLDIALDLMGKWDEEGKGEIVPLDVSQAVGLVLIFGEHSADIVNTVEENSRAFRMRLGLPADTSVPEIVHKTIVRLLKVLEAGQVSPIECDEILKLIS